MILVGCSGFCCRRGSTRTGRCRLGHARGSTRCGVVGAVRRAFPCVDLPLCVVALVRGSTQRRSGAATRQHERVFQQRSPSGPARKQRKMLLRRSRGAAKFVQLWSINTKRGTKRSPLFQPGKAPKPRSPPADRRHLAQNVVCGKPTRSEDRNSERSWARRRDHIHGAQRKWGVQRAGSISFRKRAGDGSLSYFSLLEGAIQSTASYAPQAQIETAGDKSHLPSSAPGPSG